MEKSNHIGKEIGKGTYGNVYISEWEKKKIAIKKINSHSIFLKESSLCNYLSDDLNKSNKDTSSNINKCFYYNNNALKIYMELGICLSNLLTNPKVNYQQRVKWIGEAKRGIDYMHSKMIIHGDIKPHNMIIDSMGNLKLIDFGISEFIFVPHGDVYYSIPYRPLEMLILKHCKEHKHMKLRPDSDYWALGISSFEILTGTPFINKRDIETEKVIERVIDIFGYSLYLNIYKPKEETFKFNETVINTGNIFRHQSVVSKFIICREHQIEWDRQIRIWTDYDPKKRMGPEKITFRVPENHRYTSTVYDDDLFYSLVNYIIWECNTGNNDCRTYLLAVAILKYYFNHRNNGLDIEEFKVTYIACFYIASNSLDSESIHISDLDLPTGSKNRFKLLANDVLNVTENKILKNFVYFHYAKFKLDLKPLKLSSTVDNLFKYLLFTISPNIKLASYRNIDIFNAIILQVLHYVYTHPKIKFLEKDGNVDKIDSILFSLQHKVDPFLSHIIHISILKFNSEPKIWKYLARYAKSLNIDIVSFSKSVNYTIVFMEYVKNAFGELSHKILDKKQRIDKMTKKHNRVMKSIQKNPMLIFKTNRVAEFSKVVIQNGNKKISNNVFNNFIEKLSRVTNI